MFLKPGFDFSVFWNGSIANQFCMTVLHLEALAAIALSLSILMAGAWVVQQRTGNSGWVDTIWTFSLGLVGAGSGPAMAGGDLVAAARGPYRDPHRRHYGPTAASGASAITG